MKKKKHRPLRMKIRPLGSIMLEMELLISEMVEDHDLQWSDILALVFGYLMAHFPDAREEYEDDDSHPSYYYGPSRRKV